MENLQETKASKEENMKIYLINGENGIGKTDFSVNLAERIAENERVLLTSFFRDEKSNLEDYFQKDGMISYDIADYFLGTCDLDRVIIEENKNLSFIIPPLLEDKYDFKQEDIYALLECLDTDVLIIDNLDLDIDGAIKVNIIGEDSINEDINSDFYFVNKVKDSFDPRIHKDTLYGKAPIYLGSVKNDEYFKKIIDNLLAGKKEPIADLGFFEKIKRVFSK